MATFRKNPLTGQTLINKNNQVQKDGFTNNERFGEYGSRNPPQPKKTNEVEGDPEEAKKFMRAVGLHGLADMYETNGNAAKEGKIPPIFGANFQNKLGIKIVPPGESADSGSTAATVGDVGFTKETTKKVVAKTDPFVKAIYQNTVAENSLPTPNILNDFASFNTIFTFGCLSAQELNFPDKTYRKFGPADGQMILRSSGGLTTQEKPRTDAEQKYDIDTEFYIDSVNFEEVISPNRKSRHTNFHTLDFTIREPYSMGQLLQTMYLASKNAGYNNYLEAPWFLGINFVGHQDVERSKPAIAASKKMLVIKIVNITFETDSEGSLYKITAVNFNEASLTDVAQALPCDITVSGDTLEEICQSGFNSVTTQINTFLLKKQKFKKEKDKFEPDEFIISFPNDLASATLAKKLDDTQNAGGGQATTGDFTLKEINYADALRSGGTQTAENFKTFFEGSVVMDDRYMTTESLKKDFVNNRLGYSIKRGNLSESIKKAISGAEGGVNGIGRQKIKSGEALAAGDSPFGESAFGLNEETMNWQRGNTQINPRQRSIQFRKGTKLQRVIEELVLLSDFGQRLLSQDFKGNGTVDWFRIETQLFLINDPTSEAITGKMPRINVFRIIPYEVNMSFFQMPNDPPPGYDELTKQAVKAYNYIYTGRNNDILEFRLNFDNAFFRAAAYDMGNEAANNDPSNQANTAEGTVVNQGGTSDTRAQVDSFGEIAKSKETINASGEALSAGAITESPEVRLARQFNESLVNSEVDLVTLTLRILGDPYYITDSGVGNYVSERSPYINIYEDGSMNHQSGQVDVLLNFQTPIDIDDESGGYRMNGPAVGVSNFNGLYFITQVRSTFEGNLFTQELELVKRPNWHKKYLKGTKAEKILTEEEVQAKRLQEVAELYGGRESDAYRFAAIDVNGDNVLNPNERKDAGLSYEQAAKLQKAWKSRTPVVEKTPAQKAPNKNAVAGVDGSYASSDDGFGKVPPVSNQGYDDAILRANRLKQYSSATVNNAATKAAAAGVDKTVDTIGGVNTDLSSNWTPPSQRGVQ